MFHKLFLTILFIPYSIIFWVLYLLFIPFCTIRQELLVSYYELLKLTFFGGVLNE